MTAGLPGVGISGLFFVLSALLMPVIEIGKTITGRTSAKRWRAVLRQSGMAWAIVIVLERTVWLITLVLTELRPDSANGSKVAAAAPAFAFPVAPVLIALAVLALVLVGAQVMQLMTAGSRRADTSSIASVMTAAAAAPATD